MSSYIDSTFTSKIAQGIIKIADQRISNLKLDKTVQAKVEKVLGNNKYSLVYNGGIMYAYADSDLNLIPGASVYVLVPQGDFNKTKTILGRTTGSLTNNYNLTKIASGVDGFAPIGKNILSVNDGQGTSWGVSTYKKMTEENGRKKEYQDVLPLYVNVVDSKIADSLEENENDGSLKEGEAEKLIFPIEVDNKALSTYIQNSKAFLFSAKFKTIIPTEQVYAGGGDYGLALTIKTKSDSVMYATRQEEWDALEPESGLVFYNIDGNAFYRKVSYYANNIYKELSSSSKTVKEVKDSIFEQLGLLEGYQLAINKKKTNDIIQLVNNYYTFVSELITYEKNSAGEDITVADLKSLYDSWFTEPTTSTQYQELIYEYDLDVNHMTGNPYNFKNFSYQYLIQNIDAEHFGGIAGIYLYCRNFKELTDVDIVNNIFVTDIQFHCLEEITEQYGDYKLTLEFPNGAIFDDDHDSLIVNSTITYQDRQDLTNFSNITWFKQDSKVTSANDSNYNSAAGLGWKEMNQFSSSSQNFIALENPAYENRYLCVATYDLLNTVKKEFILYNDAQKREYKITSDSGENFSYGASVKTLTCFIDNKSENFDESYSDDHFFFVWSRAVNGQEVILSKTPEEVQKEIDELKKGSYDYGELKTLQNQLDTIKGFEWDKNVFKYPANKIAPNQVVTMKCTILFDYAANAEPSKDNATEIGSATITLRQGEVGVLKGYYINIINGDQVFQYNEAGISPANERYEQPYKIQDLSCEFYKPGGGIVTEDKYTVKWQWPINNTMLVIDPSLATMNTQTGLEDLYNQRICPVNIAENYIFDSGNNQIKCIVEFENATYIETTNFYFGKVGENGTNGTDVVAKISPIDEKTNSLLETELLTLIHYDYASEVPADWDSETEIPEYISGYTYTVTGEDGQPQSITKDIDGDYLDRCIWNTNTENESDVLKLELYKRNELIPSDQYKNVKWTIAGSNYSTKSRMSVVPSAMADTLETRASIVYTKLTRDDKDEEYYHNQIVKGEAALEVTDGNGEAAQQKYYYHYPIPFILNRSKRLNDCNIDDSIAYANIGIDKDYTMRQILYNNDGRNPQYNDNQGVKLLFKAPSSSASIGTYKVDWSVGGGLNTVDEEGSALRIYNPETKKNVKEYTTYYYDEKDYFNQKEIFTKEEANLNGQWLGSGDYEGHALNIEAFWNTKDYWEETKDSDGNIVIVIKKKQKENDEDKIFEKIGNDVKEGEEFPPIKKLSIEQDWPHILYNFWYQKDENNNYIHTKQEDCLVLYQQLYDDYVIRKDSVASRINSLEATSTDFVKIVPQDIYSGEFNNNYVRALVWKYTEVKSDTSSETQQNDSSEEFYDVHDRLIRTINTTYTLTKQESQTVEDNPKIIYYYSKVVITQELVAEVIIPIYLSLNTYGLASLNSWDGNSVEINEDQKYVLAPQVGAGIKHIEDNTFTGVLMGTEKTYDEANETQTRVGLLGYNHGKQSIFLDAETGSATFGLPEDDAVDAGNPLTEGRIELVPGGTSRIARWKFDSRSLYRVVSKEQTRYLEDLSNARVYSSQNYDNENNFEELAAPYKSAPYIKEWKPVIDEEEAKAAAKYYTGAENNYERDSERNFRYKTTKELIRQLPEKDESGKYIWPTKLGTEKEPEAPSFAHGSIPHDQQGILLSAAPAYFSIKGKPLTEEKDGIKPDDANTMLQEGDSLEVQINPNSRSVFTVYAHINPDSHFVTNADGKYVDEDGQVLEYYWIKKGVSVKKKDRETFCYKVNYTKNNVTYNCWAESSQLHEVSNSSGEGKHWEFLSKYEQGGTEVSERIEIQENQIGERVKESNQWYRVPRVGIDESGRFYTNAIKDETVSMIVGGIGAFGATALSKIYMGAQFETGQKNNPLIKFFTPTVTADENTSVLYISSIDDESEGTRPIGIYGGEYINLYSGNNKESKDPVNNISKLSIKNNDKKIILGSYGSIPKNTDNAKYIAADGNKYDNISELLLDSNVKSTSSNSPIIPISHFFNSGLWEMQIGDAVDLNYNGIDDFNDADKKYAYNKTIAGTVKAIYNKAINIDLLGSTNTLVPNVVTINDKSDGGIKYTNTYNNSRNIELILNNEFKYKNTKNTFDIKTSSNGIDLLHDSDGTIQIIQSQADKYEYWGRVSNSNAVQGHIKIGSMGSDTSGISFYTQAPSTKTKKEDVKNDSTSAYGYSMLTPDNFILALSGTEKNKVTKGGITISAPIKDKDGNISNFIGVTTGIHTKQLWVGADETLDTSNLKDGDIVATRLKHSEKKQMNEGTSSSDNTYYYKAEGEIRKGNWYYSTSVTWEHLRNLYLLASQVNETAEDALEKAADALAKAKAAQKAIDELDLSVYVTKDTYNKHTHSIDYEDWPNVAMSSDGENITARAKLRTINTYTDKTYGPN